MEAPNDAGSSLDCSFVDVRTTQHPIRRLPRRTPDRTRCHLTLLAYQLRLRLLASVDAGAVADVVVEVVDDDSVCLLSIFGAAMMSMLVVMIIGKLLLNNEMNGLLMMTSRWQMMSTLYFSSF